MRRLSFLLSSLCLLSTVSFAQPKIVDDPALATAVTEASEAYLATKSFDRFSATLLVKQPDGSWHRGSVNPGVIAYPASAVKLAYLAAAMGYAEAKHKDVRWLDDDIRPMIVVSDNVATGRVVDAITGTTNQQEGDFDAYLEKLLVLERYLAAHDLLGNQVIRMKTYPSNSGSGPNGFEKRVFDNGGRNRLQAELAASLMLHVVGGGLSPEATEYAKELLARKADSEQAFLIGGFPEGTKVYSKAGWAYDTLQDFAYAVLPDGQEIILTVMSNGWLHKELEWPASAKHLEEFAAGVMERMGNHEEMKDTKEE